MAVNNVIISNGYKQEELQHMFDRMKAEGCHVFWEQLTNKKVRIIRRMDTASMEKRTDTTRIRDYMRAVREDWI